jgi:hypothetical protein
MPDPVRLEKAELRELDATLKKEKTSGRTTRVQFNPETLKVNFSNVLKKPEGAGDQSGAQQFVGTSTTKLTLQLWFDVNAPQVEEPVENDVRRLTDRVAYYITPQPQSKGSKKLVPPGVRFIWGTFQFDGVMESLDESLEMFSPDGRPLRASMTLNLSQQAITHAFPDPPAGAAAKAGTRPVVQATAGSTVQQIANDAGLGGDWQGMAEANNIENPLRLAPGQFLVVNALRPRT